MWGTMRALINLPLVVVLVPLFAIRQTTAKMTHQVSSQTRAHLLIAMRTEAFNYAKYSLYAQQTRRNGKGNLADIFEKAAETKRYEHFAVEAKLVGLVETEPENLKEAIQGESRDEVMYFDLAKEAATGGDVVAERHFDEFRRQAAEQRDELKAFLATLDSKNMN
jgi:rubrerythrin